MTARELIYQLHQRNIYLQRDAAELVITGKTDFLTENDLRQIKANKVELLELLEINEDEHISVSPSVKLDSYIAPTTNLQRNVYFLESLSEEQCFYNVPVAFIIKGKLNINALKLALADLCKSHDVLRTTYQYIDDELMQVVESFNIDQLIFNVKNIDRAHLEETLQNEANLRFNLQQEWPIRATVFNTGIENVLSLTMHHIAVDGYSAKIITDFLQQSYAHYCQDKNASIRTEVKQKLQYADYAIWHQKYLKSPQCEEAKVYWQSMLTGAPNCHNFPLEYTRPSTLSVEGDAVYRNISGELFHKTRAIAKSYNTSVFLLLQSMFAGFMARMGDESDLLISSVYANRVPNEFIDSVGMFANTIPFRYCIEASTDIAHLVNSTINQHKCALKYQQYPFESMLEGLSLERDPSYNPLVQVQFVLQENAIENFNLYELEVERVNLRQSVAKFDFSLHVQVTKSDINIEWEYNTNLFSSQRISQFFDYYLTFLECHLSNPFDKIMQFQFESQLVNRVVSKNDFAQYVSNPELIEQLAVKQPNAIAVEEGDRQCSYQELVASANRVISGLQQIGLARGERVSVYMEKSIEQVIVMYAVMRAGFTYVPLDPTYPEERLAYVCQNAKAKALIYSSVLQPSLAIAGKTRTISYESLEQCPYKPILKVIHESDAAYIIYTSGSTGKPKGVLVPHGSIYYSLQANKKVYQFQQHDSMPTIGSQAFGVSLLETFVPLISGGKVQAIGKHQITDIEHLIAATQKSTVIHMVPSLMAQWLDVVEMRQLLYPKLRLLLVGAEPVPPILLQRLKKWRDSVTVRVLYGMTESSVVSSGYLSDEHDGNGYSVGKPHPNMNFYTMNQFGVPQPVGVPGELYVGGLSLAKEYIDLPEVTNAKFVHHAQLNERLYKTGDRARLKSSGHFEFLGRVDHQVSLRGIRIETGEIESLINKVDDVKKCIAHVVPLENGDSKFVLYYTNNGELEIAEVEKLIKQALKKQIPESMRPTLFMWLPGFPHNPNGKVDRNKLPQPSINSKYISPSSETEIYVHQLWCTALAMDKVSIIDGFFELGGHSLMATKMVNAINNYFGIKLPLKSFFETATIKGCAEVIDHELNKLLVREHSEKSRINEPEGEVDEFVI